MITIQAMLSEFRSLADKSLKFSVHTQELNAQDKARLFEFEQTPGFFVFKPTPITESDIQDLPDSVEPDTLVVKSPSSRLHAVIAVFLKKYGEKTGKTITQSQIRHMYEKEMEGKIEEWKRKINELN